MLSQHDRRELADIEVHLRASEPGLVQLLERFHAWAPPRRRGVNFRRAIGLAGLAFGAVLFVTALAVRSADVLVLAVGVLLVDAAWWILVAVIARVRGHLAARECRGR